MLALRARGVDFEEISRVSLLPLHSNIPVRSKQPANAFVALSQHLPGRDAAACRAMFDTLAEKHGYAGQI